MFSALGLSHFIGLILVCGSSAWSFKAVGISLLAIPFLVAKVYLSRLPPQADLGAEQWGDKEAINSIARIKYQPYANAPGLFIEISLALLVGML